MKRSIIFFGAILLLIIHADCLRVKQPYQNHLQGDTGNNALKSYHATYLSANSDGTVKLSYNILASENWQWQDLGDSKFTWKSSYGTYLSGNQEGTLKLAQQVQDWEIWTKVQMNGKILWKSFHGTYLSGRMNMKVTLVGNTDTWEQWELVPTKQLKFVLNEGPASLKSFHNTFLNGAYDGRLSMKTSISNEGKWTWLHLGGNKYAWKSFHNTYLSARPDGSVNLQRLLKGWQIWTRIDKNGKHLWKSTHGTYLSGNDDKTASLKKVPLEWEEWVDADFGGSPVNPPNPSPPNPTPPNPTPPNPSPPNPSPPSPQPQNRPEAPGTNLRVVNKCPYTIWPGLDGFNNDGSRAFGDKNSPKPAGFELKPGQSKTVSLDAGAISMRVWARLRCTYQTNNAWPDVKTRFLCDVGECGNPLNKWDGTCFSSGGQGGNSLAQFTMTKQGHWYYDVSLVDGYTVPVSMTIFGKYTKAGSVKPEFDCKRTWCNPVQDFSQCPPELKKMAPGTNTPISCYSLSKAIQDVDLKRTFPQLKGYYDNIRTRSHIQCSCLEGNCGGTTADQVAANIRPGTGYCCSPYNPLYLDPRIKDHICYNTDKPKPFNNFGGGKRYDEIFKEICPLAYSWEFDDDKSTFECRGKDVTMEVQFC